MSRKGHLGLPTNEKLCVLGGGCLEERSPVVVVERSIARQTKRARVGAVVVIVVELNPEVVELGVLDDNSHVRLG